MLRHPLRAFRRGWRRWRLWRELKGTRFGRLGTEASWLRRAERPALRLAYPPTDPGLGPGVNLYGYLRGAFGLGQSARMYARALLAAGYPLALLDAPVAIPHARDDHSLEGRIGEHAPHAINLAFVNPDHYPELRPALRPGAYNIGFWFWELESVPEAWRPTIAQVDEIWVASGFVEQAFRRVTDKPVVRIPHPVSVRPATGRVRRAFDLDEDAFVFLCTFDFYSGMDRKNPLAVVEAFVAAFGGRPGKVQLMLKTSNGHRHPDALRELRRAARRDARILVRDQVLGSVQLDALQETADAYVSLHRAEGLGLGMAESMARAKPVVGTAWSGNLEFMSAANSCLVDYRRVPVAGRYPQADAGCWAEAEVADAASWMRRLVDEPGLAARIGVAARSDIQAKMSLEAAAGAMIARLRQLAGDAHRCN